MMNFFFCNIKPRGILTEIKVMQCVTAMFGINVWSLPCYLDVNIQLCAKVLGTCEEML